MIILRRKNVIFERFWKFHFPACSTLSMSHFVRNGIPGNDAAGQSIQSLPIG